MSSGSVVLAPPPRASAGDVNLNLSDPLGGIGLSLVARPPAPAYVKGLPRMHTQLVVGECPYMIPQVSAPRAVHDDNARECTSQGRANAPDLGTLCAWRCQEAQSRR